MPALHEVIVKPLITEKSSAAYQARKEYAFQVHPDANKFQIRDADAPARGDPGPDAGHDRPVEEGHRRPQGRRDASGIRGLSQ